MLTIISIKINSEELAPKLIAALAQVETFVMPSNDSDRNIYYSGIFIISLSQGIN